MGNSVRTFKNYTPEEIDKFLNQVIDQVERMITESREKNKEIVLKDKKIEELENRLKDVSKLQDKLAHYERMEDTLNRAIMMAQKTSDQLKIAAHRESEVVMNDAKQNANRIVNEALMRAEKIENEAMTLKRNVNIFKRRLKDIVESQLEVIEEIDKVEL